VYVNKSKTLKNGE